MLHTYIHTYIHTGKPALEPVPKTIQTDKASFNSVFAASAAPPLVEDCNEGQSMLAAGE